ncbi:transmembrane protein 265 [Hyperolius riggenbachi]|uniref:transmembrane protein 265 n=1 Tax=Hyperolius riggenbachi TaxID=752182 RepID=UPI0035A3A5F8
MSETFELKEEPSAADPRLQNGSVEEHKILIDQSPTIQHESKAKSHFCQCSHRRLAIMSIVCGISCVGIKALLLSVRAEQESDSKKSALLSRRSRKFSILSIALFVGVLVCLPILMVFVSYIMTLIE